MHATECNRALVYNCVINALDARGVFFTICCNVHNQKKKKTTKGYDKVYRISDIHLHFVISVGNQYINMTLEDMLAGICRFHFQHLILINFDCVFWGSS